MARFVGLRFPDEAAPAATPPADKPLESMSVAELKAKADAAGLQITPGMKKAELLELLEKTEPAQPAAE